MDRFRSALAAVRDPALRQLRYTRRQRAAEAVFIACYVVGWAWVVGRTDPAGWDALLAIGFALLFALVLTLEIVATARSLRASGPQPPAPNSSSEKRRTATKTAAKAPTEAGDTVTKFESGAAMAVLHD